MYTTTSTTSTVTFTTPRPFITTVSAMSQPLTVRPSSSLPPPLTFFTALPSNNNNTSVPITFSNFPLPSPATTSTPASPPPIAPPTFSQPSSCIYQPPQQLPAMRDDDRWLKVDVMHKLMLDMSTKIDIMFEMMLKMSHEGRSPATFRFDKISTPRELNEMEKKLGDSDGVYLQEVASSLNILLKSEPDIENKLHSALDLLFDKAFFAECNWRGGGDKIGLEKYPSILKLFRTVGATTAEHPTEQAVELFLKKKLAHAKDRVNLLGLRKTSCHKRRTDS